MIEKYLHPKATVLNVSHDPFVPRLVTLNRKTTIASKLQGWLDEDWIYTSRRYEFIFEPKGIRQSMRVLTPGHYSAIFNENNHCHIPPNRFVSYMVGLEIERQAVTYLLEWLIPAYGLDCPEWSTYNDSRSLHLIERIKEVIDQYAKDKLNFHSDGIQEVEDKILKIVVGYIDLLPPKEVVKIDLDPTRWERLKAWFKS